MEILFEKEQLIEEVASYCDDSEFCIHSKLVNDIQAINSSEDSKYGQESNSNSYMDVGKVTKQILIIQSKKRNTGFHIIALFNQSLKYKNSFEMYNSRKLSWSESKINYIFKHYQRYNDFQRQS